MKIIFTLILGFLLIQNATFANDFMHLGNNVYIKKESNYCKGSWCSAIFKVLNEKDLSYEILKYKASCDKRKILGIVSIFEYDKNKLLLKEHVIDKQIYPIDPSGYTNGYLYYNAICNNIKIH